MKGRSESVVAPDGTAYPTYFSGEVAVGKPGLMIFTPIFGVDGDMTALADEWAEAGFLVAVPDYFFRVTPGPLDRSEEGRKKAFARHAQLDVDRAIEDLRPLAERLSNPASSSGGWGALGYCAGGELAVLASTRLGAAAIAGFHATHVHKHLGEVSNAAGAISLHYGDADPLVPMEQVEQVKAALAADTRADVAVYAGAQHGFSFKGRPSYHEVAATRSAARARELMELLRNCP